MPALQSVEPRCQWFHTCHRDGSLAPRLALQSISVVFGALVGLRLRLCRHPHFGDPSSSICGWGVYPLAYCVASVFSWFVCLAVSLFVPGDARVSREPVDRGFDAVGTEGPSMLVDCSCKLLPWPWVQVIRSLFFGGLLLNLCCRIF